MAHGVSDYYEGSRMFSFISDHIGISIDQLNFVISQIVALLLAYVFRTYLHPAKTKATTRHFFGLTTAFIIGFFCFGRQAIHLAGLPAICYMVIKTHSPDTMQRMVLIISFLYLSSIHIHRQVYDYGSYSLDITGPLMVITQKVTSLAFNLHDGLTKKEENMTKKQKLFAIYKIPTLLEYFSFSLHFTSLMAGPAIYYKEYIKHIQGKDLSINVDNSKHLKMLEPSPMRAVLKKMIISVLCGCIFINLLPLFPVTRLKDDNFIENTSLMYKLWYLSVSTTLIRFKYYFAWTLADAISNISGLGFKGYENNGEPIWDQFSNVNIVKFEFGKNLRESIEAWNICTNRWLRMIVYERVETYPTIFTYALSALWHGFYPGYYITFANGALFTFAARIMRRTVRNHFTSNTETQVLYDVLTFVTTRIVMAYITFTFVLLEFSPSIHLYMHMYWCLHVFALIAIFIVPKVISKVDGSYKGSKNCIAQALYQARPITNNYTRHHD